MKNIQVNRAYRLRNGLTFKCTAFDSRSVDIRKRFKGTIYNGSKKVQDASYFASGRFGSGQESEYDIVAENKDMTSSPNADKCEKTDRSDLVTIVVDSLLSDRTFQEQVGALLAERIKVRD